VGTNSNGVAPTGTVKFFDGGSPLNVSQVQYIGTPGSASAFAQLQANGIFYFLSLGQHNLSAQYVGDTNYVAVSGAATAFNVVQDTPIFSSINVSGSPVAGNPTTLTATLSTSSVGVKPTGTVTFSDGSTSLSGTVTYGGTDGAVGGNGATLTASMPYTFTAAGTHNITAKYSGDTNYATATSTPQAVQVAGPFNIVPGGAITVVAGQSGSTTLTVSSNNSFNGSVTLTCMPSGSETTCGFSQGSGAPQNSLTINLTGTDVPVTFTATTTAAHTIALNRLGTGTGAGIVFCGIFLFGIPALRKRSAVLIPMLIFLLILAMASCGGGSSGGGGGGHTDPGTTRGTYNFAITGTTGSGSSAITVPAQVAVTVN
jgi:hypothetical protein